MSLLSISVELFGGEISVTSVGAMLPVAAFLLIIGFEITGVVCV